MKYALIVFPLFALLLFSIVTAQTQQENIAVTTSEGAAMQSLRTLLNAETTFQRKGGEYGDLKELRTAGLIDDELASGVKGGYRFNVVIKKSTLTTPPLVDLIARPTVYGKSARRSFYLAESGVLLTSEKKDAPVSEMRPFATGAKQANTNTAARDATPVETTDENDAAAGDVEANEASVIKTLQIIHTAEAAFRDKHGAGEYGSLEQLEKQRLLDGAHASATQNGYVFEIKLQAGKGDAPAAFTVNAVPQTYGVSGRRSFYIDQTGALRGADKEGGPAEATDPAIEK